MRDIEGFNPVEEQERPKTLDEVRDEIHTELIKMACPPNDKLDDCVTDWMAKNSKEYAEAFKDIYSQHPNLIDLWKDEPERVRELFNERVGEGSPKSDITAEDVLKREWNFDGPKTDIEPKTQGDEEDIEDLEAA